jgi:hypothetical protein
MFYDVTYCRNIVINSFCLLFNYNNRGGWGGDIMLSATVSITNSTKGLHYFIVDYVPYVQQDHKRNRNGKAHNGLTHHDNTKPK